MNASAYMCMSVCMGCTHRFLHRISVCAEGCSHKAKVKLQLRLSAEGGPGRQCFLVLISLFTQPSPIAKINIHICNREEKRERVKEGIKGRGGAGGDLFSV